MRSRKNIEDIYPLSPMQQGMLFHTLYAPESGVYGEQWSCTLHGNLQVAAFQRAWQRVVERHPVLRTAFHWESRDEPFQVVYRQVEVPWRQYDWRGLGTVNQERQYAAFLRADREQGFALSHAPLMRLSLIRIAEDIYHFVWSHHHLLLDGWSLPLLLQEVVQFYEAFRTGRELSVALCRPYGDYIAWLQQQDLSSAERFWRRTLKSFRVPTSLHVGSAGGSATPEDAGSDEQSMRLAESVTAALQALAQRQALSLNTLVQGAWALLLSRYSGQEDIVFGTTVSGRPPSLAGIESMIGLFINTLPVRVRVSPAAALLSWLQDLQARQVEARQYEYSPLVQVQRWSDVPPGLSLFESLLVFQNYPGRAAFQECVRSLEIHDVRFVPRTNYPLTVVVVPGPALLLRLSYQRAGFTPATIDRMLGHLQTLLQGMVADPGQRLGALPLLTRAERQQLLVAWNDTQVPYPQETCVHQAFAAQVECTPDAVAVVCGEQELTYRELNNQANRLAHHLQDLGVGPEGLVGLCVERSLAMVVALLGILKAGGAYVPLDPAYPPARLASMLTDARGLVLVTQPQCLARLPAHGAHVVCLDGDWACLAPQPADNPVSGVTPANLAYVMYTSGSTGEPKGVMIEHRALSNHLHWMQATFPLTAVDRVVHKTPLSFDASVWECFAPLLAGGRLIVARPGGHQDSAYLVELLAAHQVTHLKLVPSLLQMLLETEGLETCRSLRHVFCGGAALPPALQEHFLARFEARLHNLYGPTEATIDVACWTCERASHGGVVPIGRPIANTQLYVLDAPLQPVPVGVSGELYIAGASLARGYLNRPELTAATCMPHPFSNEAGARLYKTGDLARYLPDGPIECLGRLDQQVKIRGYRIELGEVEVTLERHPAIRQAVVLAQPDSFGDSRLVAYCVPRRVSLPDIQALRSFLQTILPDYMIPAAFVGLDALPLTPSGKIDRQALPAPSQARPAFGEAFVAPRTPTEELLAGIWTSVLGIEAVGIHDNFFALGGHSLSALQVLSRLRRVFQVVVPLRALFEAPTVAGLAQCTETARQTEQHTPLLPLQAIPRGEAVPLTMTQEQLWSLDQILPGAPCSNLPYGMRLTGPLNVQALEQSLNEVIKRHETLRTAFIPIAGRPAQVIAPALRLSLLVEDLRAFPPVERDARTQRLKRAATLHPFDLEKAPLLQARLLWLDAQEHILLLTLHHIISDGWSRDVLLYELSVLYNAFSQGHPSPLPELSIQYADFAHWQHQWLHSAAGQAQLAYWTQQLHNPLPVLQLPTDRPRTTELSLSTARQSFQFPEELCVALTCLSRQEGTTVFMTLLAAFKTLLYGYTSQEDIRVGTMVANRSPQETEGLIGLLANVVILRTHLSGNPTLRQVLQRVRSTALEACAHQELPFEYLAQELARTRQLERQSLFQVMFIMQPAGQHPLALSALSLTRLEMYPLAASVCDLVVSVHTGPQGLGGVCIYKTALFDVTTITRMLSDFQQVLVCLTAQPELLLSTWRAQWNVSG